MKKCAALFLISCMMLCSFSIAGCSSEKKQELMPSDTDLEFWITQNTENTDWSGHDEIFGRMGAREFLGSGYKKSSDKNGDDISPAHCVSYLVTAWPDYADGGQYITQIVVTDPEVRVRGLTVNSTSDQFDAVFKPLGYSLSWLDSAVKIRVAEKDGVTYRLTLAGQESIDVAPKLTITAEVTNREGIVY